MVYDTCILWNHNQLFFSLIFTQVQFVQSFLESMWSDLDVLNIAFCSHNLNKQTHYIALNLK